MNRSFDLWALTLLLTATAVIVGSGMYGPVEILQMRGSADGWLSFWGAIAGGLMGGIFTISAAVIAVRPVVRQLSEIKRQTAASSKMALMTLPAELREEAELIDGAYLPINTFIRHHWNWKNQKPTDYYAVRDGVYKNVGEIRKVYDAVVNFSSRYEAGHATYEARSQVIDSLLGMYVLCGKFSQYTDAIMSSADDKPILSNAEAEKLDMDILRAYEQFHMSIAEHRVSLSGAIAGAWSTIRRLESEAAGG